MSDQFTHVGVVYRDPDTPTHVALQRLREFLSAQQTTISEAVIISHSTENNLQIAITAELEQADLVIVLGGDGSMLAAARAFAQLEIPLLCINLGRLGFLADIPLHDMEPVLTKIFEGNLIEEQRLLLQMEIFCDGEVIATEPAFNDVVLHKLESLRMVEFETFIDDRSVHQQRADGMIVSTPTGSTAYALSTGGPIADPSLESILLVPVSPHAMTIRPMVVPASSRVEIKLIAPTTVARVSYDGQGNIKLSAGDLLRITASDHRVRLIHPANYDYFELLRTKLHWGK